MVSRILAKLILNTILVWVLAMEFPQYFTVTGGLTALLAIGGVLTLLNALLRPLLQILTLPLKLFATLLAIIVVNGVFVKILQEIIQTLNSPLVSFEIHGGFLGFIVVASAIGLSNWLFKVILR